VRDHTTLAQEEPSAPGGWVPKELKLVVRRIHDGLDLPQGCRAEILGGRLVVSHVPQVKHAFIVQLSATALVAPPSCRAYEKFTLAEPEGDRYIPDLGVWPDALIDTGAEDDQWIAPGGRCLFALEVTSPAQEHRVYAKAAGYARCAIVGRPGCWNLPNGSLSVRHGDVLAAGASTGPRP
jgi:hypothetical protein